MSSTTKPTLSEIKDEEDLDEFDDVLDQFKSGATKPPPSASTLSPPPPPPTATTTTSFGRPRTNTRVDKPPVSVPGSGLPANLEEENEDALTAEFAKELAKGMENLMKELTDEQGEGQSGDPDEEQSKKALRAWEEMLIQGMNQMAEEPESAGPSSEKTDFQAKIQETMNRLKEGEAKFEAPADAPENQESLKELLSLMQDLDLDNESEEDMAAVLEGMMGQLMSKEILYEPLKELAEKFPPYLENPPKPLEPAVREQYEKQLACVKDIIAVFEDPNYDESNQETLKKTVDMMSELQGYGTPPEEVMGPLPTGLPSECVVM